jgi:exodeoxyribonuclease III
MAVLRGGHHFVRSPCGGYGRSMKIASWNVNSIRARLDHVTGWLKLQQPDVLLMQELKGTEFPTEVFREIGYESVAVTQKAYNGVAVLSRHPIETVSTTLAGDETDSHARYLEMTIADIRVVNIYLPNGNPVGTDKFAYKLAWMDRLYKVMSGWRESDLPVLVGGDFNVIPEDIDCHKPASWIHDALFQPEPRARYRAMLNLGYTDAFRSLHPGEGGLFTFWDYFRQAFEHNRGIRIDHFLLSPKLAERLQNCEIDKGPRAQPKPSDHTPIIVELRS